MSDPLVATLRTLANGMMGKLDRERDVLGDTVFLHPWPAGQEPRLPADGFGPALGPDRPAGDR